MPGFVALVGAVVGLTYWGLSGALQGAFFGYVLASVLDQRGRIRSIERSLAEPVKPATAVPPPPPVERSVVEPPPPPLPRKIHREEIRPPVVPPSPPPPPPREPHVQSPDAVDRLWSWAKPYFTGPSLIVTV